MKQVVLMVNKTDNVGIALKYLSKDSVIELNGKTIILLEDIPAKHKFFLEDLEIGEEVLMYGILIGKTQYRVNTGTLMTTQNVKHATNEYAWKETQVNWVAPDVTKFLDRKFMGYHRGDGRVGTANYWLFIPLVFCENRNLDVIRDALQNELGYAIDDKYRRFTRHMVKQYQGGMIETNEDFSFKSERPVKVFPQVDGIKFLTHQGGCGGTREDATVLGKLLAAYANHPNVGGVTVLSLGCQNLQLSQFKQELGSLHPSFDKPIFFFEQQNSESEEQLITAAIQKTFEGLIEINEIKRKPAALQHLTIGVKCGGSDGFSGISANPAVGYCSDLVVALGGKVLLAEFPELCGVEQNLIDRTKEQSKAQKFIQLMKNYEQAALRSGAHFSMNPSPGNIKDGLITDAMKSAGAALKGGTSPIIDVLDYTEMATQAGLSLVCTPGNDVEATTGKAASGANLILFTTGLGTPTGNPISPTIKISTNSELAHRMADIIDIDCGPIIEGTKSIQEMGEEILEFCISAASGEVIPQSVRLGQDDFIPWKRGVSL